MSWSERMVISFCLLARIPSPSGGWLASCCPWCWCSWNRGLLPQQLGSDASLTLRTCWSCLAQYRLTRRWPSFWYRGVDFGIVFWHNHCGSWKVHGMVTCVFFVVHHPHYLSQLQVPQVSLTLRMTHASMAFDMKPIDSTRYFKKSEIWCPTTFLKMKSQYLISI